MRYVIEKNDLVSGGKSSSRTSDVKSKWKARRQAKVRAGGDMDECDTVKMSHAMFYDLTYQDSKVIVPRREKPSKSCPFLEAHRLLRREAQAMTGNADRETLSTLLLVSEGEGLERVGMVGCGWYKGNERERCVQEILDGLATTTIGRGERVVGQM